MKLASLAAVAILAASNVAMAQPGMFVPAPRPATPAEEDVKDPGTATLLSVGGTLGSLGLVLVGASMADESGAHLASAGVLTSLVTPSLGQWYSGKFFTAGMGMRAGGGVLFIAGIARALGCEDWDGGDDSCSGDDGAALALIGGGLYLGGTIYDIATAGSTAREYNEKHVQLTPIMVRGGAGVGLAGSF